MLPDEFKISTWERAFSEISSIFIPAKEILSNSFNLTAAVEKDNVRFDDTYIDIINSPKVDISVGRNSADRDIRLKEIERIINCSKAVWATDEIYDQYHESKCNLSDVDWLVETDKK